MKIKIHKLSAVLIIVLANLLISSSIFAQIPEKMSYQAVIRDADGNLVTNQTIGMQISIKAHSSWIATVYMETHTPTTNANGLVSLEIGTGTVLYGVFATIGWNWANYIFFIKTETDLDGGANYTIMSYNQLLSVPYALHAKTAETAEMADTAGVALIVENISTYSVGDFAQGGVVFWVDESGQHGLACTIEDLYNNNTYVWTPGSLYNMEAKGNGAFSGEMNTALIVANAGYQGTNFYAAQICGQHSNTGALPYGDWYLPSKWELEKMYENKAIIDVAAIANGGEAFVSEYYWSSTEMGSDDSYTVSFSYGGSPFKDKHDDYYVRAIRAF